MNGGAVFVFVALSVVVAVGIVLVVLAVVRAQARRTNEVWGAAAAALGGELEPATGMRQPSIHATVDGFAATAYGYTRSSGDSRSVFTGYRVDFPPLRLGLSIRRQGVWQQIGKFFGSQDIEVGDTAFDELVVVQGDDPKKVTAFLDAGRRLALHRLVAEFHGVEIDDDRIKWSSSGRERNTDRIVSTVRRLASVARTLTAETRPSMAEALRAQAEGDAGRAIELLDADPWESDPWEERPRPSFPDPEERFMAGQAAYAGGRYEEAAEALRDVEAVLPADEQAALWRRRAEERIASPGPPERPGEAVLTRPGEVADELFAPDSMTFDSTRRFEEGFEGRRVRWTGTLVRSRAFRSDLDFGREPGTKAVFRVHRLGWDLYGGRDVDAVVRLPAEAHDRLRDRRDEEFTFEGILLRVDALMRNVYVADAVLVEEPG